jgi:hypothetical protein
MSSNTTGKDGGVKSVEVSQLVATFLLTFI